MTKATLDDPTHYSKTFELSVVIEIEAKNKEDAFKRAQDALQEGLVEPGFAVAGVVSEDNITQLRG